ncbi:gibberellin-regulated protein 14-like [Heracleum sosnowskyi]|uniref:Gibberellin-regulated protein 14-like n=1 Tax=Heracleum sosnowskyi TaxID=360622 RepID=A0AAD8IEY0_9APIA|nr:gibberellin-regulated protein 14-like [Heracleum sosnowskyi]
MALKSFIHLLASLLLVLTMVLSTNEEPLESDIFIRVPPKSPLQSPISPAPVKLPPPVAAPVKVPPPAAPIPVKVPPPVQVKTPPPQAPVPVKVSPPPPFVKPPVLVPPVKAPPVSSPPPYAPPPPPRNTKECYPPCLVRCKLHSRKNVCLRACVTCCDRCKCVPPGQYALSVSAQVSPAAPPTTDAAVGLISFESMLIGVVGVAISFFALTAAV